MRLFCRSKKGRIIKKWYKRTGNFPAKCLGKSNGLWWYRATIPGLFDEIHTVVR